MRKLRASIATLALGAGLAVGAGLVPAGAAEITPMAGCQLIAKVPYYSGGSAYASGGRGDACAGSVSWVEVKLMHVQAGPLPDTTMKTVTRTNVTNATWSASNPSKSGAVYRTLTRSSTGASSQSATSYAP